jgi:hypothetical protein
MLLDDLCPMKWLETFGHAFHNVVAAYTHSTCTTSAIMAQVHL